LLATGVVASCDRVSAGDSTLWDTSAGAEERLPGSSVALVVSPPIRCEAAAGEDAMPGHHRSTIAFKPSITAAVPVRIS